MGTQPLLEIEEICVRFGPVVAVGGLSLQLHGGELLGLIGPNGAGKTTTLRAAAGLQAVAAGRVRVMGWDVFAHPVEVGRHVGLTPDTPALYDGLTVEQYLHFVGRCYGLDPVTRRERLDHWLQQVWLTEKRTSKVGTLSRGMRQRLAVARTLLPDPHVVLLDEPAAGLDPAGRVQFRRLLASLRDQGRAIIVSSHILADLADFCTHVAIMEHGRIIRMDSVAQIAGAAGQQRALYRIRLAHIVGDAAARLQPLDGVTGLQVDGTQITLEFERDPAAAAGLLREFLARGLPVAEFRPLEPDLEEAYLRSGIKQVD